MKRSKKKKQVSKKKKQVYKSMTELEKKFLPNYYKNQSEKITVRTLDDARTLGIRLAKESLEAVRGHLAKH